MCSDCVYYERGDAELGGVKEYCTCRQEIKEEFDRIMGFSPCDKTYEVFGVSLHRSEIIWDNSNACRYFETGVGAI